MVILWEFQLVILVFFHCPVMAFAFTRYRYGALTGTNVWMYMGLVDAAAALHCAVILYRGCNDVSESTLLMSLAASNGLALAAVNVSIFLSQQYHEYAKSKPKRSTFKSPSPYWQNSPVSYPHVQRTVRYFESIGYTDMSCDSARTTLEGEILNRKCTIFVCSWSGYL